jgi:Fe-S-cluster containining protein
MPTSSRNGEGVRVPAGPWGAPPPYRPLSPAGRAALQAVYARVDSALGTQHGLPCWVPVAAACRACGECCRFKAGGIILFASAVELAYLVAEAGARPFRRAPRRLAPAARGAAQHAADALWRCPYQQGDLCAARDARPLGCRTYFCDAVARGMGEGVYAEALRDLQQTAADHEAWWYGPACAWFERNLPGGVLR